MAYQVLINTVHTTNRTLEAVIQTEDEAEAMAQILNEHISMRVLDTTIPALSYQIMDTSTGIVIKQG